MFAYQIGARFGLFQTSKFLRQTHSYSFSIMFAFTASEFHGNCTQPIIIWLIVGTIVNVVLLISALTFVFKYIRSFSKEASKTSKLLFHAGNAFVFLSIFTLFLAIPFNFNCTNHVYVKYWHRVFQCGFGLQGYLLLILWFIRLYYAFNKTQFKLSNCTVIFIIISLSICFCGFMYGILFFTHKDKVGLIVLLVCVGMCLCWAIFLITLFIYKLIQVYKNVSKNSALISIITKNTILFVISIGWTILHCIMMMLTVILFKDKPIISMHIKMTKDFLHLFNIYVNFICILFSYNCFDGHYQSICGLTNSICTRMWYQCIGEPKKQKQAIRHSHTHTSITVSRSNH